MHYTYGDKFHLYYSLKRDSLQVVHHPVPPPFTPFPKGADDNEEEEEDPFPAGKEDEQEKKDPDFDLNEEK